MTALEVVVEKLLLDLGKITYTLEQFMESARVIDSLSATSRGLNHTATSSPVLTTLDLSGCVALQQIGRGAFRSCKLATLDFSKCVALERIEMWAFGASNINSLDFSNCTNLRYVGKGAFEGSVITKLDLSGCLSHVMVVNKQDKANILAPALHSFPDM